MKTVSHISNDLVKMIDAHYYSEDFELISSARAYYDQLTPVEKTYLEQVVLNRLMSEGSIVDILLCAVVRVPSAVPVLASRLNGEQMSSQLSRTLISALKTYNSDEAYTAVERFLDSDQELETLQALAEIDFRRCIPGLVRMMKKVGTHGVILHILHGRMKTTGLNGLVDDLRNSSATRSSSFSKLLADALHSKKDPYNPFSESEIQHIMAELKVT